MLVAGSAVFGHKSLAVIVDLRRAVVEAKAEKPWLEE